MMTYIATFFSHFGAIRYRKRCEALGYPAKVMPVPRALSSSCGSCVRYEGELLLPEGKSLGEVEQIVRVTPDGFVPEYREEGL